MQGIPIETERLILRCPESSDFEDYAAFRGSDRAKYVGGPNTRYQAHAKLCELVGHWHIRGFGRWMVVDKASDQPLGVVGLYHPDDWPEPELAWSLFEAGEGRGIAYEAALKARDYAYSTLGWSRIISCVMPDNDRSAALAKRLGAKLDYVFDHVTFGPLPVWKHPAPEAL